MITIEVKDPPPFGLITPDALSPCLFTLLQQLGHEGVNKASSPSTASIKTSARRLRSLSGPCQTTLCATIQLQTCGSVDIIKHIKFPSEAAKELL